MAAHVVGWHLIYLWLHHSLLSRQVFHQLRYLSQAWLVEGIKNELALTLGVYYPGFAEDGQVLAGYTLLETQFDVEVSHRHTLVLLQQVQHFLPQLVVDGTKYQNCLAELCVVQQNLLLPFFESNGCALRFSHRNCFENEVTVFVTQKEDTNYAILTCIKEVQDKDSE